ncbi:hypothetical protein [Candidatus Doolittlea endobia]|nr:hypothetical protein [Candidatus Doolittlea endobia]
MFYEAISESERNVIMPGIQHALTTVDLYRVVELKVIIKSIIPALDGD